MLSREIKGAELGDCIDTLRSGVMHSKTNTILSKLMAIIH